MKKRVAKILRQIAEEKTNGVNAKKVYKQMKRAWRENTATKK